MTLLEDWKRQLEQESAIIALARQQGKAVRVVLYVDHKGKVGSPQVTVS